MDRAFGGEKGRQPNVSSPRHSSRAPTPRRSVGGALRHLERLHALRLEVEGGLSASAAVERRSRPFTSAASRPVEKALRAWTSERLAKVMSMLPKRRSTHRKQSDLAETIARRALTMIAERAGARDRP